MTPERKRGPQPANREPRNHQTRGRTTSKPKHTPGEYVEALACARHLAEAGVPLFLADPVIKDGQWDPDAGAGGYVLPDEWQRTEPDPAVVDRWEPGMALCAVMGGAVDGLDVDPRHGGDATAAEHADHWPTSYGRQATPSGGWHDLIAPLGVRKDHKALPGVDVQAGDADGEGRGFLFLAPTRKRSKATGEIAEYTWTTPPNLDALLLGEPDDSGAWLAERIRALRTPDYDGPSYDGPAYDQLPPEGQRQAREHVDRILGYWQARYADAADLDEGEGGEKDHKARRWEALARDGAWALALLACHPAYPLTLAEAREAYLTMLGPLADDPKCAGKWTERMEAKAAGRPCEPPTWHSTPEADFAEPYDGDDGPGDRGPKLLPRLDLRALLDPSRPPRQWVAEPLLAEGVSVSLVAPAGQKKSLFMLRLAIAVARCESDWAGLVIPKARRVLYVDMELTEDDWVERLTSFGIAQDDADALDNLIPLLLPNLPPLDTAEGARVLRDQLVGYGLEPGDLLMLDSYQRVTAGAENDSDTSRAFFRHTGQMLKKLGTTVLRSDNTGKDVGRGARGTAGKRDDVDAELLLTSEGEELRVTLGSKIRQRGEPTLVLRIVEFADGRTVFEPAVYRPRVDVLAALDAALADGQWHNTSALFKAMRADGVKAKDGVLREALCWAQNAGRTESRQGPKRSLEYRLVRPAAAEEFEDDLE